MYNLNEVIEKRIAALRKASGMTQEVLAEKLNCSIKHISHVERGVASLSLDLLIEASDILNCSLDYLVRGENSPPEAKIPSFVLRILGSRDERMAREKKLPLSYLNMYKELRKENLQNSDWREMSFFSPFIFAYTFHQFHHSYPLRYTLRSIPAQASFSNRELNHDRSHNIRSVFVECGKSRCFHTCFLLYFSWWSLFQRSDPGKNTASEATFFTYLSSILFLNRAADIFPAARHSTTSLCKTEQAEVSTWKRKGQYGTLRKERTESKRGERAYREIVRNGAA